MPLRSLILTLLVCCPLLLCAQQKKGAVDISAGVGLLSQNQISVILGDVLNRNVVTTQSGVYFLSAKYFAEKRLGIGLTITYEQLSGYNDETNYHLHTGPTIDYNFNISTLTFAPELTWSYLRRRYVILYTSLGLAFGHNFISYDYHINTTERVPMNDNFGSFQYSPFGVRFGRKFAGFFEIGYGYKGLLSMGMSYAIKKHKKETEAPAPMANPQPSEDTVK